MNEVSAFQLHQHQHDTRARVEQRTGDDVGEVEYHNQLSSKNLTERNETYPLTTNRMNKVESQQELRQFAPAQGGEKGSNNPTYIYSD